MLFQLLVFDAKSTQHTTKMCGSAIALNRDTMRLVLNREAANGTAFAS